LRKVSLLVCECDPDLNEFQEVDNTSHGLVVVIRGGLESTDTATTPGNSVSCIASIDQWHWMDIPVVEAHHCDI